MIHSIAIESTAVNFASASGLSLLDGALQAGIDLPYSCGKGVCGSCVGSIASGEGQGLKGATIRNDTCDPDRMLYCVCEPVTDAVLRPLSGSGWTRPRSRLSPTRCTATSSQRPMCPFSSCTDWQGSERSFMPGTT